MVMIGFLYGRQFYTAIGHQAESYSEPHVVTLLEQGIEWAAGFGGTSCPDNTAASTPERSIGQSESLMKRYIDGEDCSREHASPGFPEHLDDYITEDNPVRVIDTFVD